MSENLFGRVRRLVSGTVYGGIDAAEAAMPETVMREAIREIERTIDDVRVELRKVTGERHIAGNRIKLSQDKIASLRGKAEMALKSGRDDLAQAAVERELDLEAQIPVLEETREEAGKRLAELNSYIAALQGRKAEMEAELDSFQQARAEAAVVAGLGADIAAADRHEDRVERAEQAFDRVLKNTTGVEGMGRSERETMAKLVELETLERQDKVSKRLQAYREQLAQQTVEQH